MGPGEYRVDDAVAIPAWERREAKLLPTLDDVDYQIRAFERDKELSKLRRMRVDETNYGKFVKMRWEDLRWIDSYQKEKRNLSRLLYQGWEKNLSWSLRRLWVVMKKSHRRYLRSAITFSIVVYCESQDSTISGRRIRLHRKIVEGRKQILPAEYFELPDFDEFVRDQILDRRQVLKGLKEFPKIVPRETLLKEMEITARRLLDLLNEGFLKSQNKNDVIDFIARREIDPHKPGRKKKRKN